MDILWDKKQTLYDCLDKIWLKRNPHPTTTSYQCHPILSLSFLYMSFSAFYEYFDRNALRSRDIKNNLNS